MKFLYTLPFGKLSIYHIVFHGIKLAFLVIFRYISRTYLLTIIIYLLTIKTSIMKTQTILTMLLLLFFFTSVAFAQQPSKSHRSNSSNLEAKSHQEGINIQSASSGGYDDYVLPGSRGTAYFNSDFTEGVIVLKDGTQIDGKPLRYNLYTQQMQFIEGTDTLGLGKPDEIEYIRIDDHLFVYTKFICNNEHKSGYFELLEDGNCRLLKRWSALYHEVDSDYGNSSADNCFYRDCQCFLQFFMNPATPVLDKKKDFVKSFANNGDNIKDFMKEGNLKPRNEEDLTRIIDYYNNL